MSTKTAIQWTDVTDNIIVVKGGGWWCRMISEGCVNCYAAKLNQSDYFGGNHLPYTGQPPELILRTDLIDGWTRQRNPKRHFVASMTDIFGDWVTKEQVFRFLDGMLAAPKQTFQMLTKRSDIARDLINEWVHTRMLHRLPAHMWIGVSIENQKNDHRLADLLNTNASVRFLSLEPLLGPINLNDCGIGGAWKIPGTKEGGCCDAGIDWVIVGGESGPGARPCNVAWVRDIVKMCRAAYVPCFVKQLGARPTEPIYDCRNHPLGEQGIDLKHPKGGDMEEWPSDLRVREFPP